MAESSGILVLGMHRSGTSAMAKVLALGGANIGSRVAGASAGNEAGHWEDALAVEIHERLLAGLGCRWDEAFALPSHWIESEPASQAREEIRAYLASDRARHPLWAVKDPRLSLFARLWREEAQALGMPLGALLMLRNPAEVASSLAARDGIAPRRGMLVWLEYTIAAIAEAETLPSSVVRLDSLLDDWRGVIAGLRHLPGAEALRYDGAASKSVESFLDKQLRHHHVDDLDGAPRLIRDAWQRFSGLAGPDPIPPGTASGLADSILPLRELLHPLLDEARVSSRLLWARIERAEDLLAVATQALPASMEKLGERLDQQGLAAEARADQRLGDVNNAAAQAKHASLQSAADAALAREAATQLHAVADQAGAAAAQARDAAAEARDAATAARDTAAQARDAAAQARDAAARAAQASADAGAGMQSVPARLEDSIVATTALGGRLSGELADLRLATGDALGQLLGSSQAAAAHDAHMRERLESLSDLIPRHEEALASLGSTRLELVHTRAELLDTDRAFMDVRQSLASAREALGATRRELAETWRERGAEVDRLLAENARLGEQARKLGEVLGSRSWRITRPLRVTMRLLTGQWSRDDASRLQALWRRSIAWVPFIGAETRTRLLTQSLEQGADHLRTADLPDAALAPLLALAPAADGLPDVFVWAVIDWHFRIQRPQHLARALSEKGHRVFYVSVNFSDNAEPGFHVEPLDGARRLYQLHLNLRGEPQIYASLPKVDEIEALKASLGKVLEWTSTRAAVSLVQHPYWSELARSVPNARVVYDCMDHHGGFEDNDPTVLAAENALVRDSELVIVTSGWLQDEFEGSSRALAVIRNAGEYEFFANAPAEVFHDPQGRKVIGYYGAIAKWFDVELVRTIAQAHPDALVVLVGHDSIGAAARLGGIPNLRMVGEVPYAQLPYWLHAFDVCLLPFQVIPLTLATNPVKLYEYFAAGKPVVAVDLPEMSQFGGLVRVASDHDSFVAEVGRELARPADPSAARARQAFAAEQTWGHRAEALDAALRNLHEQRVTVVVLTYNNLAFTQACLDSIELYSDYRDLEVIVVDNASSDGSREFLQRWARESSGAGHVRKLILNEQNLGFAAGNNIGLAAATGDVLVMLNNDTYVTPGWVRTLCNHLRRNERLGLVGPVTNNIGNEAKIDIDYADMSQMIEQAGAYTRRHPGRVYPMRTVAFFCVALPRAVYEAVGGLDEAFGQGFFEDDDYCRRAEAAGWQIACADDVFVHHHLSASFNKVAPEGRAELFQRNKSIYERKWGTWQPHSYRRAS